MSPESETVAALKRAGRRALIHLVKAGIEGLKAVEAFVDELAKLSDGKGPDVSERPHRIELE